MQEEDVRQSPARVRRQGLHRQGCRPAVLRRPTALQLSEGLCGGGDGGDFLSVAGPPGDVDAVDAVERLLGHLWQRIQGRNSMPFEA